MTEFKIFYDFYLIFIFFGTQQLYWTEQTKLWTEKLLRNTEAVLTPNPGNRAEDFIFEKIEKKKPTRLSNFIFQYLMNTNIYKNFIIHSIFFIWRRLLRFLHLFTIYVNFLGNLEYLGLDMIEVGVTFQQFFKRKIFHNIPKIIWYANFLFQAGGEFGQEGAYGSALIKVGQTEQKLGQTEREFTVSAENCFIQPLRRFLEGEMRTILREKGILESKRY